jgi:hypothetical protein
VEPHDTPLPVPYEKLTELLKDPGTSKGTWALKIHRFPDKPPRRGFQCSECKTWRYSKESLTQSLKWMRCDCDAAEGNPTGACFTMAYRANHTVGAWARLNGMDREAGTAIRDLVTDLLHLAEAIGLDPVAEVESAYGSFLSETGQAPL